MPIVEARIKYFPGQIAPERIQEEWLLPVNHAMLDAGPIPTVYGDTRTHERPDPSQEVIRDVCPQRIERRRKPNTLHEETPEESTKTERGHQIQNNNTRTYIQRGQCAALP